MISKYGNHNILTEGATWYPHVCRLVNVEFKSCWNVLDELKVDKSKVFVILTKCDGVMGLSERIDNIGNNLGVSNPIAISSKSIYGIRKLKAMVGHNLYPQSPSKAEHSAKVKKVSETGAYVITADIHT